jgi:microcystin-dependent protein
VSRHWRDTDVGIVIAQSLMRSPDAQGDSEMRTLRKSAFYLLALTMLLGSARGAAAQSEPLLGQIMFGAFTFAPRGWAECNGQIMSISQNTALFSLLGTTYGGNGQTTFALPDMRGRMPTHAGQGYGLTPRTQGEMAGEESVALTTNQMPAHSHDLKASNTEANVVSPSAMVLASKSRVALYASGPLDAIMSPLSIVQTGGSQPHDNMPPYLTIKCFIALEGAYPSRP